jgi:hypothetical protein
LPVVLAFEIDLDIVQDRPLLKKSSFDGFFVLGMYQIEADCNLQMNKIAR